jgi:hypothetical protein
MEGFMFDARRRQLGRLFFLLLIAGISHGQGPATTVVSDVVYRADGARAAGTLLISWPSFITANGEAVAGGTKSVTLGPQGALSVALIPNTGVTPTNAFYTVVFHLDDGTVRTQYWVVPTTSPTTIAAVRTTLGSTGSATQLASRQYVDLAVAAKASDAVVVHKTGGETIAGSKQFSAPPSVPTPVLATDAANKGYVDGAVANSGNGSYVSKAGDTMSGPLMLSGDPTAPNHASTRHYVDIGLAAKANLVGGVVPSNQLGSGAADATKCLKGDSSWATCAGGLSAGMQAVKYSSDFNWSQTPATDLSTPGAKTVSLVACSPGVKASELEYYVYISVTGIAEAVKVTGGTCGGDGQGGTLQFTTINAHPAGYTITSASGGLQEALTVARFIPSNPTGASQSGKVIVPPGEFKAYARVSLRASNLTLDFSGSIVECYMNDSCLFVGDPNNSNLFENITIIGPRGRPMVASGTKPFIEVNAQKTRIFNVATRTPTAGNYFGSYVQVDDDQAFLLDGLDTNLGYGVRCDATFCGAAVTAPGPFNTWSAVGWLKNLNISPQCSMNGIDWQSGNTLRISDSVIQGAAQFHVRTGTARGGFGPTALDNVYVESGVCTNPTGNIGRAGVIAQGQKIRFTNGEGPAGSVPQFANTGSTQYRYYLVPHHVTFGYGNPLYAGSALTNGSGSITVTTPDIAGADKFDLLRATFGGINGDGFQAPYGTGNWAVVTNVTRGSACASGVCTFTDTQAALSSYTVAATAYYPKLDFWPGDVILSAPSDSNSSLSGAVLATDILTQQVVSVSGEKRISVFASACYALGFWTPMLVSCAGASAPTDQFYEQGALLLPVKPNVDGGIHLNLKGRLNFPTLGTAPGHIITLSDSNFKKTTATGNNRPTNDANDAFIGYDQGNGGQANIGISIGAPVSLSSYIGNVGDGTNWKERLTAILKEFKTDLKVNGALTVTGQLQADSFVSTGSGAWSVEGSYGTMTAAAANKSKLGFGASGKLSVSENAAAPVEVAKLDSNGNVSANANTATQLTLTPTQCNGSYATGIQANGNANCSTPDIIRLAETSQPTGTANYGIFWFDQTCHCPKIISNNGQPVQLGLLNVFNSDANTLEAYNGTNPQTFNVYGTRTDASNYERAGLTYDAANAYYVLDVEKGGTGTQRGFGIKLQGTIRWAWDTAFNFKPFSDNNRDLGSSSLRVRDFYLGRNLIMSSVASTYNGRTTAGPGLVALYGAPVSTTANTAAIASTALCSTTACPAGQYVVDYYADSTVTCSSPGSGSMSISVGWTDETSAKTLQVSLVGAGISGGNSMALGNTSNFGSGSFGLWSSGSAAITYSTGYTGCTTGTGTYALRMAVRQVQ